MDNYYYLLINLATISIPLLRSFEPRIRFFSRWKGLLLGIAVMAVVFILWDMAFTSMGVWGFNEKYLTGFRIGNLPVEEWLFFITVPYACLFIYETLGWFVRAEIPYRWARAVGLFLVVMMLSVGFAHLDRWYTALTFLGCSAFLLFVLFILRPPYLGKFFLGYGVSLIPFFVVNGILTGSWIPEQIVWYNNDENLGIRLGTIPVEDSMYMLLMLLMATVVYEWWKQRNNRLTAVNVPSMQQPAS